MRTDRLPLARAPGILLAALCALAVAFLPAPAVPFDAAPLAAAPPGELAWGPCRLPGLEEDARCGTLPVPLTAAAGDERAIGLAVAILPSRGASPSPDPVVVLQGGPGQGAIGLAPFYAEIFAGVRERRAVILADQRGTGSSFPLACDVLDGASLQEALDQFLPPEAVRRCREALAATTDLAAFGTVQAVADLERLRQALGAPRLNLYGTSYGTRLALAYAAAYPHAVRSLVLKGVAPPEMLMPLDYPQTAETALQRLLDDCLSDAACEAAFPAIRQQLAAVLERLEAAPAEVLWTDPVSGEEHRLLLRREILADTLRTFLYAPSSAVRIPGLIAAAAGGDFAELVGLRMRYVMAVPRGLALGMFLSVTCSEDLPWIAAEDAVAAGRGTAFGEWRWRRQEAACREWPVPPVATAKLFPPDLRIAAPALLISGWLDPVTPPATAERALRILPNARHVVVRGGGHSFDNLGGCVETIIEAFIADGFAGRLDTSCAAEIELPPFPAPGRP